MARLSKRNYQHNEKIPLPPEPINGQSLGAVSGMKYGRSTVSYSGCEVIAVYNALLLSGMHHPFVMIARYMERFRVMLGFWGSNFLTLGHCLRHYGLRTKCIRSKKKLLTALREDRLCLYVYWTGKRFRSSVHTVCLQHGDGEALRVYNAYNSCDHVFQTNFTDYLQNRRMILAYIISIKDTKKEKAGGGEKA